MPGWSLLSFGFSLTVFTSSTFPTKTRFYVAFCFTPSTFLIRLLFRPKRGNRLDGNDRRWLGLQLFGRDFDVQPVALTQKSNVDGAQDNAQTGKTRASTRAASMAAAKESRYAFTSRKTLISHRRRPRCDLARKASARHSSRHAAARGASKRRLDVVGAKRTVHDNCARRGCHVYLAVGHGRIHEFRKSTEAVLGCILATIPQFV